MGCDASEEEHGDASVVCDRTKPPAARGQGPSPQRGAGGAGGQGCGGRAGLAKHKLCPGGGVRTWRRERRGSSAYTAGAARGAGGGPPSGAAVGCNLLAFVLCTGYTAIPSSLRRVAAALQRVPVGDGSEATRDSGSVGCFTPPSPKAVGSPAQQRRRAAPLNRAASDSPARARCARPDPPASPRSGCAPPAPPAAPPPPPATPAAATGNAAAGPPPPAPAQRRGQRCAPPTPSARTLCSAAAASSAEVSRLRCRVLAASAAARAVTAAWVAAAASAL